MLTYPHRISHLYGEGQIRSASTANRGRTVWPSEKICTAVTAGRKIQKLVVSSPDGKTMKRASGKRLLQPSHGLILNEKIDVGKNLRTSLS